jgi:integral membrane protein
VTGGIEGALLRYRVMAFIVGTALVVLVFVGIPLQVWAHNKGVVEVVGPFHGFLYIVYLITGADLAFRCRWGLIRILLVVASGLVPFLAFFVEHWITGQVRAQIAASAPATDPEPAPDPESSSPRP